MATSGHDRPYGFFDLPREIRDDVYSRTMSFHNDILTIILAPKGKLPHLPHKQSLDRRAGLYKQYREFVNLLTISRQFRAEALPIFWQGNSFRVSRFFSLTSTPELLEEADTALNFIGPSGKTHIAKLKIPLLCTVFVKQPRGEYDTDLGVTIKGLLDMMPSLQTLELPFWCSVKSKDYPGEEKTDAVLQKAAGSLLEFSRPVQCSESSEPPKLMTELFGNITGRPVHAPKSSRLVSDNERLLSA